jgi:superoxide dismutase, Cu-Zn family
LFTSQDKAREPFLFAPVISMLITGDIGKVLNMRHFHSLILLPLIAGCATPSSQSTPSQATPPHAKIEAEMSGFENNVRVVYGTATLTQNADGSMLTVAVKTPAAMQYGMHIHGVGKCDGPDFASAGGHWNPGAKQHGADNPMGAHMGDLPNLDGMAGQTVTTEKQLPGVRLTGEGGLMDADGAALVIHAKPDDYKTDPSGNSGARIMCGVFRQVS